MNGQVEVTWRTLRTIAHYLMVHARVFEAYINFALMYTTDHIFLVLPIKDLINEYCKLTTPFNKTFSIAFTLNILFPFVVWKAMAHIETKMLNMRHQAQKGFRGIFLGIPYHQKGYLVYVPSARKIISSYDLVFDGKFLVC